MTANFCPRCGQALETRDIHGVVRRVCGRCGYIHWGEFSVGVGAVVVHEGRVLLVQRAEEPGRGQWTVPGGYCEHGERIEDAVVREVMEETGVLTRVGPLLALRDLPRATHNEYLVFAADYVSGEAIADGVEVNAAGFFALEELAGMPVAELTRWLLRLMDTEKELGLHTVGVDVPAHVQGLFTAVPLRPTR